MNACRLGNWESRRPVRLFGNLWLRPPHLRLWMVACL